MLSTGWKGGEMVFRHRVAVLTSLTDPADCLRAAQRHQMSCASSSAGGGGRVTIKVGDRVAFSRAHLRSTRQLTGWAPFARGTVTQIDDFGRVGLGTDLSVATIAWSDHEPTRVNVKDLVREDQIHLEPADVAAHILGRY